MTITMRWERGRYSTLYGYAGELNATIATIGWSTQLGDPKPHRLRMDLPGFRNERAYATQDEAKAAALRIVSRFVERISAGAAVGSASQETSGQDGATDGR